MCNPIISNRFKVPCETPVVTVFSSKFTIFYVQLARNYGYLCGILTMFFHCSTIVALEGEIFGLHAKYS